MQLYELTIDQIHEKIVRHEISAAELTRMFFERIDKIDKEISAYLALDRDGATLQAEDVDKKIAQGGTPPLLGGVLCAVKDNILVEGLRCTAGSKILENYTAPYDATVIKKLKKEGVVILGKTNLDEFAMGASTENSAYFPTRNPWDKDRVPGGSSGGSAAAVAAHLCTFALGSDTGGSIRQPASFCGVAGFKPTYGMISRSGLIAMGSSLDQIGPLAKSVRDCEIIFDIIKGEDPFDSTSVGSKNPNPEFKVSDVKIGIPKEYFGEGLDSSVKGVIEKAITFFEKEGAKIQEISLPYSEYSLAAYYIVMSCEVSANLARYDGIRYGGIGVEKQKEKLENLIEFYGETRRGLGAEVRRRVMLGTYALSAGYYDAYFTQAQKVRTLIRRDFEQAFEKVDMIIAPASATCAFRFGEKTQNPLSMYLTDVYTVPANLAGIPALSIPAGFSNGLPVGIQLIGSHFADDFLLEAGKWFEANYNM